MSETMKFSGLGKRVEPRAIITEVYQALKEKGYNLIMKLERDELLEELFKEYLKDE